MDRARGQRGLATGQVCDLTAPATARVSDRSGRAPVPIVRKDGRTGLRFDLIGRKRGLPRLDRRRRVRRKPAHLRPARLKRVLGHRRRARRRPGPPGRRQRVQHLHGRTGLRPIQTAESGRNGKARQSKIGRIRPIPNGERRSSRAAFCFQYTLIVR